MLWLEIPLLTKLLTYTFETLKRNFWQTVFQGRQTHINET